MDTQFLIACNSCRRQYDVTGMRKGEQVRCRCGELMKVPDRPTHEARILHCSACGGRLRAKTSSCDYCGGEVLAADRNLGVACPECFARLPHGARFCSECGLEIRPESIRATRSSASCPRCKGSLILRELPQGHYTECGSCGGIWLDADSFDRVVEARDADSLGQLILRDGNTRSRELEVETVRYVPCPVCGQMMHRKNFARCSGVIIDWCKGHGFWFDANELEKIVSFIKAGGLDKARQMEIQQARSEIKRLEEQKKRCAFVGQGWEPPTSTGGDWIAELGGVFSSLLRNFF